MPRRTCCPENLVRVWSHGKPRQPVRSVGPVIGHGLHRIAGRTDGLQRNSAKALGWTVGGIGIGVVLDAAIAVMKWLGAVLVAR